MKVRLMSAAAALATTFGVSPATATQHIYHSYHCTNNTVLRVVFDDDHHTATVNRIRQPVVRLTSSGGDGGGFRYTRGDRYELAGNTDSVTWRVGQAEWTCPRGG